MIGDIRSKLITLISTDAIKAYLDTFTIGANEHYAIFVGKMIPERYQDLNNTILIYRVSPQGSGDIRPLNYTVNCRQSTELNSIALADLVYDVLNRTFHTITDGDMYMQAVIQPTIYEDENCWNCPVEINVRNNL
jgi:hypothetical protein